MPVCRRCGDDRPDQDFYKNRKSGNPLRYCKVCCKAHAKAGYDEASKTRSRNRWRDAHKAPATLARLLLNNARGRARSKTVPFTLTREWIEKRLVGGHCEVTGRSFDFTVGSPWVPSLDRTKPSEGYTPENTRVVVWLYNAAKHEFGDAAVLEMARLLVANAAN